MDDIAILLDQFTGGSAAVAKWDFGSLTTDAFETKFETSIRKPLRDLLRAFERNPAIQFPRSLQASMLGLINGLADYYSFILSREDQQKSMNLRSVFGPTTDSEVGLIDLDSIAQVRDICLSIIDPDREQVPFNFRPRSLQEIKSTFAGPAFASQRMTLERGVRPGVSFPLLVCWRLSELVNTTFPDTFIEPSIIQLVPCPEK